MDVSGLARGYRASLPDWIDDELAEAAEQDSTEGRLRLLNRLARRNFRAGTGGPFAAMVVEAGSGRIVSVGVNLVLASNLSAAHAEVVAISLAQTRLGGWDLGGSGLPDHALLVNWRPCAQCYGAVLWSGVRELIIAGEGPEVEQLTGFDEGPMRTDWADQLRRRGIAVTTDVLRDEAIEVFTDYRQAVREGRVTVYNARGAGAILD